MSIGRIAEYADLLGYNVVLDFVDREAIEGTNRTQEIPPVFARSASGGAMISNPNTAPAAGRKTVNEVDHNFRFDIAALEA